MGELTLEEFVEILDDFLTKNHIQMLIEIPKGTQDVTIIDNTEEGPLIQLYILFKALPSVFKELVEMVKINHAENLVDRLLDIAKSEILEALKDKAAGEKGGLNDTL